MTCPDTTSSAQLPLQAALKLPRVADPVGVRQLYSVAHTEEDGHECANLRQSLAGGNPCVLIRGEHAHDIVVLVHRLAKVPPLLLVPPVGMGIAELALDAGRVDVAAVLREIVSPGNDNVRIRRL